jgi:hypothetical protein
VVRWITTNYGTVTRDKFSQLHFSPTTPWFT